MFVVSSLFVILLRISMAFQGQVEVLADAVHQDFFASQGIQESAEQEVRHASVGFTATGSLVPTIEIEEKVEVEAEESGGNWYLHTFSFDQKASISGIVALYGNKALRGSRLPLYDFFHSWKIHLS
jgi:hypothetical protein